MSDQEAVILQMSNISKSFPGVKALNNVSIDLKRGEVLALVGENGAGKSTLVKNLLGIYVPDEGEIKFKGAHVHIAKPLDALNLGISMIHQELSLVPKRTAAENIWIYREPRRFGGIIDWKQMYNNAEQLLQSLNIDIDPRTIVSKLSVAGMQMVEIARAISYNAEVIIMDEPTSALTAQEAEKLFTIIRSLVSKGISVIYISHKLDEIFELSDRVTVLRDGKNAGTEETKDLDEKKIISMMVGRNVDTIFPKAEANIGDVVLSVRNFSSPGKFEDVSFDVRSGEILGISGLMGAGRTELARGIFGLDSKASGEIEIYDNPVKIASPEDAIRHGIGMVPEDRKLSGLVLVRSVLENVTMTTAREHTKMGMLNHNELRDSCQKTIKQLSIKTPSAKQLVKNLSGGNQQKVVIGNWLLSSPRVLILDEPTRGIDVGAKSEIHRLMSTLAGKGLAIIMISSEMPEILGMSDRIMVMHKRKLKGFLDIHEATEEKIMQKAIGGEV